MRTHTVERPWAHLADGLRLSDAGIEIGAGSIETLIKEEHQQQVALRAARDGGLLDDCQALIVKDSEIKHRQSRVSDLSPLAGLTQLKELSIHCKEVEDITPLATLSGLQRLKLVFCTKLLDLSPLSTLTSLNMLDLQGSTALALPSLAALTQLTSLNLRSTHLRTCLLYTSPSPRD